MSSADNLYDKDHRCICYVYACTHTHTHAHTPIDWGGGIKKKKAITELLG